MPFRHLRVDPLIWGTEHRCLLQWRGIFDACPLAEHLCTHESRPNKHLVENLLDYLLRGRNLRPIQFIEGTQRFPQGIKTEPPLESDPRLKAGPRHVEVGLLGSLLYCRFQQVFLKRAHVSQHFIKRLVNHNLENLQNSLSLSVSVNDANIFFLVCDRRNEIA